MDTLKGINSLYNQKQDNFLSNNKVWLAIFGGAVAAIAVAAIFYPEKSKQLFNDAAEKATDLASKLGDSASTYAQKIGESASEYAGKFKETASDYAGKLKSEINTQNVASAAKDIYNKRSF